MKQRYEKLEALETVRPLLVVAADCERLEVACDFFQDYVDCYLVADLSAVYAISKEG